MVPAILAYAKQNNKKALDENLHGIDMDYVIGMIATCIIAIVILRFLFMKVKKL